MRTTPTSVSVAVLLEKGGKLLLVRQAEEKTAKWGPPAGHVELGESIVGAAKRETREETGLKIKLIDLVGIYTIGETKRLRIAFVFRGRIESGKPRPQTKEISQLRWFSKKEVRQLLGGNLYKSEYNRRCLNDWFKKKSYPLSVLREY